MTQKVAVVTGANRGLGKALAIKLAQDGIFVILVSRSQQNAEPVLDEIIKNGGKGIIKQCDVSNLEQIEALAADISKDYPCVDILINNAAINKDTNDTSIEEMPLDLIRETMETNFFGPLWMCKHFLKLLKQSASGRIVNFSSGLGQLGVSRMGPYPAYSMSKTAINAITKNLAEEVKDSPIIVTSVDPGWVLTDMGGPNAMLTIPEGIDTPYWLATAPAQELQSGSFYKERQILEW